MTNFNEKVKCGIGYILNSQEFFIDTKPVQDESFDNLE